MKKGKLNLLYKQATDELLAKAAIIDKELEQIPDLKIEYSVSYLTKYLRIAFTNEPAMEYVFDMERKINYSYAFSLCDTLDIIYKATGEDKFWKIRYISKKEWDKAPHWYLETKSGIIFDITFDQYTAQKIEVPYYLSRDYTDIPKNRIGNIEKTKRLAKVCNFTFYDKIINDRND